jgi:hypothetical protein
VRAATEKHKWLTILPEAEPLRFTFAIGTIPIRFYRGGATDVPGHYLQQTFVELHQQQLALQIDGLRLVDRVLRLAVEIDATGEVENIILVEMDTAGTVTETYRVPLDDEAGKVTPLQLRPVELGPPQVEPLAAEESEAEKKNARHVRSK